MKVALFKRLSFYIISLIVLFSCIKGEAEIPTSYSSYLIELSSNYDFISVDYISNDTFRYSLDYLYSDSIVEIEKRNINGDLVQISTYYLTNQLADSSITTFYENNQVTGKSYLGYEYNSDGYLIRYNSPNSNIGNTYYEYQNGNRISIVLDLEYGDQEVYYYSYSTSENIIDIDYLLGNFRGKINRNLMSREGPPGGQSPGTAPQSWSYEYEINDLGLVSERIKIYTSSHRESIDADRSKVITSFEYILQ